MKLDYQKLQIFTKLNPMAYEEDQDIFIGNSVSMFTPVLQFILHEKIGQEALYVDESMEVNGKRTFGYDDPIIYKRIQIIKTGMMTRNIINCLFFYFIDITV